MVGALEQSVTLGGKVQQMACSCVAGDDICLCMSAERVLYEIVRSKAV